MQISLAKPPTENKQKERRKQQYRLPFSHPIGRGGGWAGYFPLNLRNYYIFYQGKIFSCVGCATLNEIVVISVVGILSFSYPAELISTHFKWSSCFFQLWMWEMDSQKPIDSLKLGFNVVGERRGVSVQLRLPRRCPWVSSAVVSLR